MLPGKTEAVINLLMVSSAGSTLLSILFFSLWINAIQSHNEIEVWDPTLILYSDTGDTADTGDTGDTGDTSTDTGMDTDLLVIDAVIPAN